MLAEAGVGQHLTVEEGVHSSVAVVVRSVDRVFGRPVGNTEHTLALATF